MQHTYINNNMRENEIFIDEINANAGMEELKNILKKYGLCFTEFSDYIKRKPDRFQACDINAYLELKNLVDKTNISSKSLDIFYSIAMVGYDLFGEIITVYWLSKCLKYANLNQMTLYKTILTTIRSRIANYKYNLIEKDGYGFEKNNAIDVPGVRGEMVYLDHINVNDGELLYYYRSGSVGSDREGHIIDKYIVVFVKDEDINNMRFPDDQPIMLQAYELYLDMYNDYIIRVAPDDFQIVLNFGNICKGTNFCI